MRYRTTFLLLVAVLLLGGGIWYLERETEGTKERAARARQALDIEPEQIRYLRIEATNLVVVCRLAGSQWRIESPLKSYADKGEIRRILTGLKNLPKGEVITLEQRRDKALRLHDYGLETPRARITVRADGEAREILIGNESTVGDSLYVMEMGSDDVVSTSRALLDLLPPDLETLRSRRLIPDAPYVLQRLEIRRPAGFLLLSNDPARGWSLQQPVDSRAHGAFVRDLIAELSTAEISRFVEDGVSEFSAFGLDESGIQVSMMPAGGGRTRTLQLGSPDATDPELVFARVDDGSSVYGVSRQLYTDLMLDAEVFRDRQLIDIVEPRIVFVKVTEGDEILELLKDDAGSWSLTRPRKRAADSDRVWALISAWAESRILDYVSDTATNLAEFGLASPTQTILLSIVSPTPETEEAEEEGIEATEPSPEGTTQVTLHLYRDPADSDRLFAQRAESTTLVATEAHAFPSIMGGSLALYDRTVLQLVPGDIRKIELQDETRRQVVLVDKAGNAQPAPDQDGEMALPAVEAILAAVTGLNARRMVADDPNDLAAFGLAKPLATLTFGLTGDAGISKSLMFGADAGADGRFAMIRGQGAVFILSPELCGLLLSDLVELPAPAPPEDLPGESNVEEP